MRVVRRIFVRNSVKICCKVVRERTEPSTFLPARAAQKRWKPLRDSECPECALSSSLLPTFSLQTCSLRSYLLSWTSPLLIRNSMTPSLLVNQWRVSLFSAPCRNDSSFSHHQHVPFNSQKAIPPRRYGAYWCGQRNRSKRPLYHTAINCQCSNLIDIRIEKKYEVTSFLPNQWRVSLFSAPYRNDFSFSNHQYVRIHSRRAILPRHYTHIDAVSVTDQNDLYIIYQ